MSALQGRLALPPVMAPRTLRSPGRQDSSGTVISRGLHLHSLLLTAAAYSSRSQMQTSKDILLTVDSILSRTPGFSRNRWRKVTQGMPLITLEKPGVESKPQSSPTGQPAGLGPDCAGAGAAPRRPQLQGKSSRRHDPAGLRWVGLAAVWASHSGLAEWGPRPLPDPGSGPLPTPLAHLRSPDSSRPQASAHAGGRPWPSLSEAGQAVPHDTPGSAFPCRHSGARPRWPASRCCW